VIQKAGELYSIGKDSSVMLHVAIKASVPKHSHRFAMAETGVEKERWPLSRCDDDGAARRIQEGSAQRIRREGEVKDEGALDSLTLNG
jgi:hypothetical protein